MLLSRHDIGVYRGAAITGSGRGAARTRWKVMSSVLAGVKYPAFVVGNLGCRRGLVVQFEDLLVRGDYAEEVAVCPASEGPHQRVARRQRRITRTRYVTPRKLKAVSWTQMAAMSMCSTSGRTSARWSSSQPRPMLTLPNWKRRSRTRLRRCQCKRLPTRRPRRRLLR